MKCPNCQAETHRVTFGARETYCPKCKIPVGHVAIKQLTVPPPAPATLKLIGFLVIPKAPDYSRN